jgi:uncharacterized repeat protein (TIGR01451 family)
VKNLEKKSIIFILGLLLVLVATISSSSAADTIYVNNATGSDSWDGTNAIYQGGTVGPKATIQNGTDTVDDNGLVYVAAGTYQEHLNIAKNVFLIGESQLNTIIDGTNNGRPLTITSGTVNMTNFCIQNGNSNDGGGINNAATLILNNCTIQQNTAQAYTNAFGGGIFNTGTLILNNCTLTQNSAQSTAYSGAGGAIINIGSVTMTSCIVTQNSAIGAASNGGAIFNNGYVLARYNIFRGNTAQDGSAIANYYGYVDAQYNWWGSNNDPGSQLHSVTYSPWLYFTLTANPNTINNKATSLITASFNNAFDGTTVTVLDPSLGYIPDGILVTINTDLGSIGSKTIQKTIIGGLATVTLTADETPGTAHLNAVADSQPANTEVIINAKSSLYLTVTPNKNNPVVGDTVLYTLKVGNNGPDPAENVVMTYVVPEGLIFAGANLDSGTYTYDPSSRTLTWTLGTVPQGDPNLWLSLYVARVGQYLINPRLTTTTNDPTLNQNTQSITINAAHTVVTAGTIGMQKTGIPVAGIVLALLMVTAGLILPLRKK